MSHDPDLTINAANKLDTLLRTYPEAKVSGVYVRVGENAVVVTKEGRFEWFKQNHLGGIQKEPDERDDAFGHDTLMRGHTYRR